MGGVRFPGEFGELVLPGSWAGDIALCPPLSVVNDTQALHYRLVDRLITKKETYLTLFRLRVVLFGKFVEVLSSYFHNGGFIPVKRPTAFPAGSVPVAWRGGLVPPVSPRVARKRDLLYSVPPRGPCSRHRARSGLPGGAAVQ